MTYYSNIPTILTQQDFNNSHADMLASARGEIKPFISVEELTFTIKCRPEWLVNIPDIKHE
jgi:hypothetical protein